MGYSPAVNNPQPARKQGFEFNTRLRQKVYPSVTRPTGGGLSSFQVSKVGLLKGIHLAITGSVTSGGLSNLNNLGKSCIIRNVRVYVNNGNSLYSVSGAGWHWHLRDYLDGYNNPTPGADGRSAVATGAYDISMYIPIMQNERDPIGLVMLQNEATYVTVEIDWESDAVIATGISALTGTVVPTVEFFQVPARQEDWPNLKVFHSIIEDKIAVAQTSGDYVYQWPKGNIYLAMYGGYGFGVTPTESWDMAILRANQTDMVYQNTPAYQNYQFANNHGYVRAVGTFAWDLTGTNGLGFFGGARDQIDSNNAAEINTVLTVNAAKTLYQIRRMLIDAQY